MRQETLSTTKGTTKVGAKYWSSGNTGRAEVNGNTELRTRLGLMAVEYGTSSVHYDRDPKGNLLSSTKGTAKTYFVTDKQGSVVLLLGEFGQKVGGYSYDPYGITRSINGTEATANPFRYIGGQYANATGLYKMGARYYDPAMGRFTQLDPSGQDPHYTYAVNNPCNMSDPTGLSAYTECLADEVIDGAQEGMFWGAIGGGITGAAVAGVGALPGAVLGATGGTIAGVLRATVWGGISCTWK